MFERFHHDARRAVVLAQEEARRLHQHHTGPEHLLLGLLESGPSARVLRDHGIEPAHLRSRIEWLADPSVDPLDPNALAALGIDLDEVRRTAEANFGAGALDAPRGARPGRKGHIPFTPEAKKALELSLRHAIRLKHRRIDTGHLLLGVLHVRSALVARLLQDAGVDPADLRTDLDRLLSSDAA